MLMETEGTYFEGMAFTPIEDRVAFEGASKSTIREHFRTWVETRSVERDGPGADSHDLTRWSPRYGVCMYVDKEAMQGASIKEMDTFRTPFAMVKGQGGY